jgi:hypothetical protein
MPKTKQNQSPVAVNRVPATAVVRAHAQLGALDLTIRDGTDRLLDAFSAAEQCRTPSELLAACDVATVHIGQIRRAALEALALE